MEQEYRYQQKENHVLTTSELRHSKLNRSEFARRCAIRSLSFSTVYARTIISARYSACATVS